MATTAGKTIGEGDEASFVEYAETFVFEMQVGRHIYMVLPQQLLHDCDYDYDGDRTCCIGRTDWSTVRCLTCAPAWKR